jgi:hypothetical protein
MYITTTSPNPNIPSIIGSKSKNHVVRPGSISNILLSNEVISLGKP